MAASSADKFTQARGTSGNPSVTTVSAARSVDGTSLSATALTDWPTDTQVHFITYSKNADGTKDNTSQCDWKGTVSSSTSITAMTLENGTDAGNAIGDFIEMGPTATWAQDLYDGLTKVHDTTGSLLSEVVDTAQIKDSAVTASKLDFTTFTWEDYTPTLVGWSGTPTTTARYAQYGSTVKVFLDIEGTSNSTTTTVTLPSNAKHKCRWLVSTFDGSFGSDTVGIAQVSAGSNVMSVSRGLTASSGSWFSNFASSGLKQVIGAYIEYEAA